MIWQVVIEVIIQGIGYFLNWNKEKKEAKKWLAETAQKLRARRLVRQAFVEKHARESHDYIVDKKEKKDVISPT